MKTLNSRPATIFRPPEKKALLLIAAFVLIISCAPSAKAQENRLPSEWDGVWKGTTFINWANGKADKVEMELEVNPLPDRASKTWKIIYRFADREEVRNYEIKAVGGDGGGGISGSPKHFLIDEKNGFLIDNYLFGDTLYSQFLINGNLVTTSFALQNRTIAVELTMFDVRAARSTKLTGGNFEVSSYKVKYVQQGTLKRFTPKRKNT